MAGHGPGRGAIGGLYYLGQAWPGPDLRAASDLPPPPTHLARRPAAHAAPLVGWLLLAAFPAHLAAELQSGVPTAMVLCWFVTNCSEALIGAIGVRWLIGGPLRLDSFQHVSVFVLVGGFLAAFASSFLDAALVTLIGWGEASYWQLWRTRFFSNLLANLTLVPVIVPWAGHGFARMRRISPGTWVEGCVQTLRAAGGQHRGVHPGGPAPDYLASLLYAPVPFLAVGGGPVGAADQHLPSPTAAAGGLGVRSTGWGRLSPASPWTARRRFRCS